eukprot:scaffold121627_cov28-Tisochrysis_lutea.AAC.1
MGPPAGTPCVHMDTSSRLLPARAFAGNLQRQIRLALTPLRLRFLDIFLARALVRRWGSKGPHASELRNREESVKQPRLPMPRQKQPLFMDRNASRAPSSRDPAQQRGRLGMWGARLGQDAGLSFVLLSWADEKRAHTQATEGGGGVLSPWHNIWHRTLAVAGALHHTAHEEFHRPNAVQRNLALRGWTTQKEGISTCLRHLKGVNG